MGVAYRGGFCYCDNQDWFPGPDEDFGSSAGDDEEGLEEENGK